MKQIWLLLLLLMLVFSSCKKDSNSGQNIVEFDLDGVHYSYTPTQATVTIDTLQSGGLLKNVSIYCRINSIYGLVIAIGEDATSPSSDCISTGTYPGISFSPGCGDSVNGNCRLFSVVLSDAFGLFGNQADYDSLATLNLVSCNGSPSEIEGTFSCDIVDVYGSTGNVRHITGGKVRGVSYIRQ